MHSELEKACKKLEIDLPKLKEASELSANLLSEAQKTLKELVPPNKVPIDVVVLGSLARHEVTPYSDLDYVVIVHSLPTPEKISSTRELLTAAESVRKQFNFKKPGRTGMFGIVLSAPELTERIGLEQDTNLSHSRRILLLQESASIYQPALHKKLIEGILCRYLIDYTETKKGVPRFLLNDVMRYWRTLAVDYQAKRWESIEPNWGLRFLKLIISRKIVFAGTLVSLLLTEEATVEYFYQQFSMPPLARIAQLYNKLEQEYLNDLATILNVAEVFLSALSIKEFRDKAKEVKSPHEIEDVEFKKIRSKGRELQRALENIFYRSSLLKERAITYLNF